METTTIVMFTMQGLLTIVMALGMFILAGIKGSVEKVDKKLDLAQTKENCINFHDAHKEIHKLEKINIEDAVENIKRDVNNIAVIARSKVSRTHIE